MYSCWLNAHLLSRDSCPTVRSVPLSVRTVCLTGLIIRVWRGLPDWRPFKCWILKCHFAASAAAAAQALRRVSGAGNVIAHILQPVPRSLPLSLPLFSYFSSAFSAIVSLFSLFCVSCTLPQILRLLCYFNMNLAHKVDLQSPFTSCSSPFLHCDLAIQPVWLPHPKTFNFFCLMAFLCIANCRSACFQLGISIMAPRETSQRLQETF